MTNFKPKPNINKVTLKRLYEDYVIDMNKDQNETSLMDMPNINLKNPQKFMEDDDVRYLPLY